MAVFNPLFGQTQEYDAFPTFNRLGGQTNATVTSGGGMVNGGSMPSVRQNSPSMAMPTLDTAATRARQAMMEKALQALNAGSGGSMPSLPSMPQAATAGAGRVAHVAAPDLTKANDAAFARAKDKQGAINTASLTSLRSVLGGRNLLGSGAEYRGTSGIAQRGMGELGQVNRDNAMRDATAAENSASQNYQGDITQRGQDLAASSGSAQAQNQMALARFNAEIGMREAQQRMDQSRQMQAFDTLMKLTGGVY